MSRDRGASLVEFALVLPLLLMIVIGLVSAGVAYNLKITLTHAAREAARYATILPVPPDTDGSPDIDSWLGDVKDRLFADAANTLGSGNPTYCIAYVDGGNYDEVNGTGLNTKHLDETGSVSSGWCFDDTRGAAEWRVQVQVSRDTDFNVLFFSKTITLGTEAVSRYEVLVNG